MDLFLMQHAVAAARDFYSDDAHRPLTEAGRQDHRRVAHALAPVLQPLDRLLSSPFIRARQTADIVAEAIQFAGPVEETPILGADCTLGAVLRMLESYPRGARILCVGHEPDMSRLAAAFLDGEGRSIIMFQPGSVISLTFPGHPTPGRGQLRLFLRPAEVLALLPGIAL